MGSPKKKMLVFNFLLIMIGVVLVVGVEFTLRVSGFGEPFRFLLQKSSLQSPTKYCINSQYMAIHYYHHLPVAFDKIFKKNPWFSDTEFLKKKPKETYRIFSVGASTTRGFPFRSRRISYSGILEAMLKDVLPGKNIEVINLGYDALSSYGVLDIVRHIVSLNPDLIIAYTGHNEFIGHFGGNSAIYYGQSRWIPKLAIQMYRSRLFLFMELSILKLKNFFRSDSYLNKEVNLFQSMLGGETISWTEDMHQKTVQNFEANLREIVEIAQKSGVPILLSTLVANLKDFAPVLSDTQESPEKPNIIYNNFKREKEKYSHNRADETIRFIKMKLSEHSSSARIHFDLARAYEERKDYRRAKEEYINALEFDKLHLRACRIFNQAIEKVGKETKVPVVDMVSEFEKTSQNKLVGKNLFLEHVHPNINGHLIMADAFARSIARNGLMHNKKSWKWDNMRSPGEYVRTVGFSQKEYVNSRYTIGRLMLGFPFYRCQEGIDLLREINLVGEEIELIENCQKNSTAGRN